LLSGSPRAEFMGLFSSTPTGTGTTPSKWKQSSWSLVGPSGATAPPPAKASLNYALSQDHGVATNDTFTFARSSTFSKASITRVNGDWVAAGFTVGETIEVTNSTSNNGTYTVASVSSSSLKIKENFT